MTNVAVNIVKRNDNCA